MANTYTQIHIHIVFAVQNRSNLIGNDWKEELYKYISGIIKNNNHKVLVINGMPDHIHILIGLRPAQSLSELVKQIKQDSTKWINERGFINDRFSWQSGFGAFSYSKSQIPRVINYIKNQEEHHKTNTFKEEYKQMLKDFDIDFHNLYIFKSI